MFKPSVRWQPIDEATARKTAYYWVVYCAMKRGWEVWYACADSYTMFIPIHKDRRDLKHRQAFLIDG